MTGPYASRCVSSAYLPGRIWQARLMTARSGCAARVSAATTCASISRPRGLIVSRISVRRRGPASTVSGLWSRTTSARSMSSVSAMTNSPCRSSGVRRMPRRRHPPLVVVEVRHPPGLSRWRTNSTAACSSNSICVGVMSRRWMTALCVRSPGDCLRRWLQTLPRSTRSMLMICSDSCSMRRSGSDPWSPCWRMTMCARSWSTDRRGSSSNPRVC